YNFMTPMYHEMLDEFSAGHIDAARQLQLQSAKLVSVMKPFGFLGASKLLMRFLGVDCGQVRSPLRALTEEQSQKLFETLEPFSDLFPNTLNYVSSNSVTV
ncbi:dihydrodipicolinate synthase family protein, partial [Planctomycetaceae bacterium]|nr:dihydrodipicolinate synthase family protein [Planctomycetaceae bacterium]